MEMSDELQLSESLHNTIKQFNLSKRPKSGRGYTSRQAKTNQSGILGLTQNQDEEGTQGNEEVKYNLAPEY